MLPFFVILFIVFLYFFHGITRSRTPNSSISGRRGYLYIYGIYDQPFTSPYSGIRLLKFNDRDYLTLAKYILYSGSHLGETLDQEVNISIKKYSFLLVNGHGIDKLKNKRFSIAFDKGKDAILLLHDNVDQFCKVYNGIIKKCRLKIQLDDQAQVENYSHFIHCLIIPIYEYHRIDPDKFDYDEEDKSLELEYIGNKYIIRNVSPEVFKEIIASYNRKKSSPDNDHVIISFPAIDYNKFKLEKFSFNYLEFKIFSDGRVNIKQKLIAEFPVVKSL